MLTVFATGALVGYSNVSQSNVLVTIRLVCLVTYIIYFIYVCVKVIGVQWIHILEAK